jgi:hypothetical protein
MLTLSFVACSGPGAARAIARAEVLGWVLAGASLAIVLPAVVGREALRRHWWLLIPVAGHPGWWMSARSGDCGHMLSTGAITATVLTAALVGLAALRMWRAR